MAISADSHDESRILAKEGRIGFSLLSDADLAVATAYGVAMQGKDIAIPATFIIDQAGNIHWKKVGETQMDRADFDRVLALLDGVPRS